MTDCEFSDCLVIVDCGIADLIAQLTIGESTNRQPAMREATNGKATNGKSTMGKSRNRQSIHPMTHSTMAKQSVD
jgi:hypothetical protein